jgi:hypothetical protein
MVLALPSFGLPAAMYVIGFDMWLTFGIQRQPLRGVIPGLLTLLVLAIMWLQTPMELLDEWGYGRAPNARLAQRISLHNELSPFAIYTTLVMLPVGAVAAAAFSLIFARGGDAAVADSLLAGARRQRSKKDDGGPSARITDDGSTATASVVASTNRRRRQ